MNLSDAASILLLFQVHYIKIRKLKKPCNVVVVGGGTAGLEAACTAAEVGCATVLIEKSGELGGLARRVGKMPNKQRLGYFPSVLRTSCNET